MSRRIWLSILLFVALVPGLPSRVNSAELRTTVAEQTVYRTVAFERVLPQELSHEKTVEPVWDDTCLSCGVSGCGLQCVQASCYYANLEYLLWWRSGSRVPPLVTTSPTGTASNVAGVLPGAQVLFGNERISEGARPGGRLTFGMWLDDCGTRGVEARFFSLGKQTQNFNFASQGTDRILARPFTDATDPANPVARAVVLAHPALAQDGSVNITAVSEVLGGDVLFRMGICSADCWDMDFVAGYQFARIDENLLIQDSFNDQDGSPAPVLDGTIVNGFDQFDARNEFHAGQFGLEATYWGDCWRLELLAKVALGNMNQVVEIAGGRTSIPAGIVNSAEGLLANAGNIGRRERNEFAVAPEFGVTMAYQVQECVDLSFGYSAIYFSKVAQAGEQIDPNLLAPSPSTQINSGSYWLHGLRLGAEVRF